MCETFGSTSVNNIGNLKKNILELIPFVVSPKIESSGNC